MTNNLIKTISEAYEIMLNEEVKPKFSVGDKVGIGSHEYNGIYSSHDTGVVSAVDKKGNHTVTHDTQKDYDSMGSIKPRESVFNSMGIGKSNMSHISPIKDHLSAVAHAKKGIERTNDLNLILTHLMNSRSQNGVIMAPLHKTQADYFKTLLDKHTEE